LPSNELERIPKISRIERADDGMIKYLPIPGFDISDKPNLRLQMNQKNLEHWPLPYVRDKTDKYFSLEVIPTILEKEVNNLDLSKARAASVN